MIRLAASIPVTVLLCGMSATAAQPSLSEEAYKRCETVRDRFNEARTKQDVEAMAAVFARDAIRVTPDGVFQGRDAIRQNLESLVGAGLRDFSTERNVVRREGPMLLDAGAWRAKLGDLPLHGYYSALVSCAGDHQEILEETTNVAAPPRR